MNNPNGGRFMPMQLGNIDNSPHDIREYWTPERKKATIPVSRAGMGTGVADTLTLHRLMLPTPPPRPTPSRRI